MRSTRGLKPQYLKAEGIEKSPKEERGKIKIGKPLVGGTRRARGF